MHTASENPPDEAEAAPAQTVDLNNPDIDWSQLDPAAAGNARAPADPKSRRAQSDGAASSWSAQDKSNGAAALSVKQSMIPFWDTQGRRRSHRRPAATLFRRRSAAAENHHRRAAILRRGLGGDDRARPQFDLGQDRDRSPGRSVPGAKQARHLAEQVGDAGRATSLTLQNGSSVTQQGLAAIPGITGHAARNYALDQSAKLSIADTGTSFVAGQIVSSTDDKWLRKIGAEQKLFGGVSVSGSIGETLQGTANKSISAGFKRSW